MRSKHDRLRTQGDSLSNIQYEHNDLNHTTPGLSNSEFASPVLVSTLGADVGLFDNDEPTRIRSLKIKSKYQPLTSKEKDYLKRYYYMSDNQKDKVDRRILGEGYKISKKLLGLNAGNSLLEPI